MNKKRRMKIRDPSAGGAQTACQLSMVSSISDRHTRNPPKGGMLEKETHSEPYQFWTGEHQDKEKRGGKSNCQKGKEYSSVRRIWGED